MKGKDMNQTHIKKLYRTITVVMGVSLYINLIMYIIGPKFLLPIFLQAGPMISTHIQSDAFLKQSVDLTRATLPCGDLVNNFYKVAFALAGVYLFTSATLFFSYVLVFRTFNKYFSLRKIQIIRDGSIFTDMKFIGTWMTLYSTLNTIFLIFPLSDDLYNFLAHASQVLVFFLLLLDNAFGFKIRFLDSSNEACSGDIYS